MRLWMRLRLRWGRPRRRALDVVWRLVRTELVAHFRHFKRVGAVTSIPERWRVVPWLAVPPVGTSLVSIAVFLAGRLVAVGGRWRVVLQTRPRLVCSRLLMLLHMMMVMLIPIMTWLSRCPRRGVVVMYVVWPHTVAVVVAVGVVVVARIGLMPWKMGGKRRIGSRMGCSSPGTGHRSRMVCRVRSGEVGHSSRQGCQVHRVMTVMS